MSADPKSLYQEVILDHNKKPRNYGTLSHPSHEAEGLNPLCGDHIHVALDVADDTVREIAFNGESCAICKASASMMTQAVKGKSPDQAEQLVHAFVDMASGRAAPQAPAESLPGMARLAVFSGIRDLPMRVKCAVLPWHTLQAALKHKASASTENQNDPMQAPMGDA